MVTTNDEALWRAMWSYKDHGKCFEVVYERQHAPGFRWLHESFGTNWRMLEMQAVLGRIQLRRMKDWSAARVRNAQAIWAACAEFAALRVPQLPLLGCGSCPGGVQGGEQGGGLEMGGPRACAAAGMACEHAHYKCYAYVRPERLAPGWSRDRIIEAINAEGVPCFQGSCSEVYLEKAFDGTGWRPAQPLPVARALGETSIMFLVHPTLTQAEVDKTCEVVRRVMGVAGVAHPQTRKPTFVLAFMRFELNKVA